MTNIEEKLVHLKRLTNEIEQLLEKNVLDDAHKKIIEYTNISNDSEIYKLKATYFFQRSEYDNALQVLQEGVQRHPFSFVLHLNLGFLYEQFQKMDSGLKYYAYAMKYAQNENENQLALDSFHRLVNALTAHPDYDIEEVKKLVANCKMLLKEIDARVFPLDSVGSSLVRSVKQKGTSHEYMVNMYRSKIGDVNNETRLWFKTELLNGRMLEKEAVMTIQGPTVVPISLIEPQTAVVFSEKDMEYSFEENDLALNQYHYLRFNNSGNIKVASSKPIFIGNPIPLKDELKKTKLVLKIFIDGLSYDFLEKNGLANVMPNTYDYFRNGFISTNTYATSEWTLPSKASINTGVYSTKHKLLHPHFAYPFEMYQKLLAEYLKEAGYYTTYICNNWRTTPTFGYYKGYSRILFQNFLGGMDCRDTIMEVIEHLETFKEKNSFVSFSLMDLHNVPDEIEETLLAQVHTDISNRVNSNNKGKTSVLTKYDERKIAKYYEEASRIDVFLGLLYDFIKKNYSDDEVLVVLHSDHGQTFLDREADILHPCRRKIPLMIRGHEVSQLRSDELIEAVDILPIILNQCKLEIPFTIDGRLPEAFGGTKKREFTLTQVIHPNQVYRAVISDENHEFRFETVQNVGEDLSIDIESHSIRLTNLRTGEDEKEIYTEKVEYYEDYIFDHIKDFIKIRKN